MLTVAIRWPPFWQKARLREARLRVRLSEP
jgi:hypothetical protein